MDQNAQDNPANPGARENAALLERPGLRMMEKANAGRAASAVEALAAAKGGNTLGAPWVAPATGGPEPGAAPPPVWHVLPDRAGLAHDLGCQISQRAVELKSLNQDSMTVVLRPDQHTELSLQLHRREGGIEVRAHFERGNYENLNAHWAELQSSLAPKGIRLGGLACATPESGTSTGGQTGAFERGHGQAMPPEPVILFEPHGRRATTAPAKPSRLVVLPPRPRSWETWA
jgi:hypothetical protein